MQTRIVKLNFKKNQKFATVGATSCWHIGNARSRQDKIEAMLRRWKRAKTPWVNLGDTIDGIYRTDKRYHCETTTVSILAQIERVAELSKIAKDTMIGTIIGNHDNTISGEIGCCIKHMLHQVYDHSNAEQKYLGATAMVDFQCPEGMCRGLFAHGRIVCNSNTSDPVRDRANDKVKLQRKLQNFLADFKIVGHGHKSIVVKPEPTKALTIGEDRKEKMVDMFLRPEWCAMSASMFASYGNEDYPSYAELAMYPPQDIGYLEIDIDRSGNVVNIREMLVD